MKGRFDTGKSDGTLEIKRDKLGKPIKFSYKTPVGTLSGNAEERRREEQRRATIAAVVIESASIGLSEQEIRKIAREETRKFLKSKTPKKGQKKTGIMEIKSGG